MSVRTFRRSLIAFLAVLALGNMAWALGFQLSESKEQLRLKYDVSAVDHGTGRVTVVVTVADTGRLAPLTAVDLVVPGLDKDGYVDLSLSLAPREVDGKQEYRIHLARSLAERAEVQLRTSHLDGRQKPLTWYYHPIPLAPHLPVAKGAAK